MAHEAPLSNVRRISPCYQDAHVQFQLEKATDCTTKGIQYVVPLALNRQNIFFSFLFTDLIKECNKRYLRV